MLIPTSLPTSLPHPPIGKGLVPVPSLKAAAFDWRSPRKAGRGELRTDLESHWAKFGPRSSLT